MQNKFIARQAILDKNLNTYAYELLHRGSLENVFQGLPSEKATSQVIFQNHILGELSDLCLGKVAFINFDQITILQDVALLFDKKDIVVELMETIDLTAEIVFRISELYKKGYTIALDGYDFSTKWDDIFSYVSIIKIDVGEVSFTQIKNLRARLPSINHEIKILAERIETRKQFQELKDICVDYFQGYFFHKPEVKSGYNVLPLKLNLLKLFLEVYKPNLEFEKISQIVSRDVVLVSGTLKLVNNASESANVEITSIKQAITYLGTDKIKQYVAIISMSTLSSDSPNELLLESIVRAKTMEYISSKGEFKKVQSIAFITGILSNLDSILNSPLEDILEKLPLTNEVRTALINQEGLLFDLLVLAQNYEKPSSEGAKDTLLKYDVSEEFHLECYHKALNWCMTYVA